MSPALRDGRPIGGDGVTEQKAVGEKYTDGFRRGDLAQILSRLTDDVGGGLVSRLDTFHIWLGEVPA